MQTSIKLISIYVLTLVMAFGMFFAPLAVNAEVGLTSFVPDECYGKATQGANGQVSVTCGWDQLMELGQNILRNGIYLAAMLAVVSIVYAGYLFMSAGDNSSTRDKAKGVLWNVILGIFFTMAAWLLVATILKLLGVDDAYSLLR